MTAIALTEPTGWRASWRRWVCRRVGHDPMPMTVRGLWQPRPRLPLQMVVAQGKACRRCNTWVEQPDWPAGFNPAYTIDFQVEADTLPPAMPAVESSWDR